MTQTLEDYRTERGRTPGSPPPAGRMPPVDFSTPEQNLTQSQNLETMPPTMPFLDSLSSRVSKLDIVTAKKEVFDSYDKFKREQTARLQYQEEYLQLKDRLKEIESGVNQSKYSDKDFGAIKDPEIIKNLISNAYIDLRRTERSIDRIVDSATGINPFDPGQLWTNGRKITDSFAQIDLQYLITADLANRDMDAFKASDELMSQGKYSEALTQLEKYRKSIPDFLQYTEEDQNKWTRIDQNFSSSKLFDTPNLIDSALRTLIERTPVTEESDSLLKLASNLAHQSLEGFSMMGWKVAEPSEILDPRIINYLMKNHSAELLAAEDQSVQQNVMRFRHLLWDSSIPWNSPVQGEEGLRLTSTAYATLKRISILESALLTGLEEADTLPENERQNRRQLLTAQFWKLYHDTSSQIEADMQSAIRTSGESMRAPYEALIGSIRSITPESAGVLYNDESFKNSRDTYEATVKTVDRLFQGLSNQLEEFGGGPKGVMGKLRQIEQINSGHPEHGALRNWIDSFPVRFERFGVRRQ
ncbi:MAG TPA: hypothetical protein PKA63_05930 [Oligoflexia bacterium]|nr:hypothetical protein [Oligoflexia bacterium]HMP48189.1 hypothetical protein [Oligoflexia bacterium]